jgi:hypothetical protein
VRECWKSENIDALKEMLVPSNIEYLKNQKLSFDIPNTTNDNNNDNNDNNNNDNNIQSAIELASNVLQEVESSDVFCLPVIERRELSDVSSAPLKGGVSSTVTTARLNASDVAVKWIELRADAAETDAALRSNGARHGGGLRVDGARRVQLNVGSFRRELDVLSRLARRRCTIEAHVINALAVGCVESCLFLVMPAASTDLHSFLGQHPVDSAQCFPNALHLNLITQFAIGLSTLHECKCIFKDRE